MKGFFRCSSEFCNFCCHLLDSSVQTKQQQSVKVLQLLVYTAAQTDAREFIEMVFSTSAGQIVFNSYKDRTPLPEDVAQANGHEELAQYLEDISTRFDLVYKFQNSEQQLKKTKSNIFLNRLDFISNVKINVRLQNRKVVMYCQERIVNGLEVQSLNCPHPETVFGT